MIPLRVAREGSPGSDATRRAVGRPSAATAEFAPSRILVVVEGDDASREPIRSGLLARAVEIARNTACEIELFQVCSDAAFIRPRGSRAVHRARTMHECAARLTALVTWLKPLGIRVSRDVRWGCRLGDTIAAKIADSSPDLVLKASRRDSHVHGPTTPADRHLVASTRVPLWLTRQMHKPLLAVSVGVRAHLTGRQMTDDHAPLRWSSAIARSFGAALHVVHGCESADSAVSSHCRRAARALERNAGLEQVVVCSRDTLVELPSVAISTNSALVTIDAADIEHLDVTARPGRLEPSLAQVPCDLLVVGDPTPSEPPGR